MKGETPLDYAVFQLNEAHSRCELWICAGDKNEKLASGSFKPFLAHLRAAKEQTSKGANFIILQAPPFVGDGSPWFTKRTIERFVRFVSTPDILESVSVLEAELSKLDDASTILISDTSWSCDTVLKSAPVTPRTGISPLYKNEAERSAEQPKTYTRRPSFDYAGVALLDGSKRDLLKAMETRRMMLLHEQKKAFSHATAAGFSVSCISDLMVFANCFGAPRLWEACLKFMTLCKKRQETGANPEELLFESASFSSTESSIQLLSNQSETSESSEGSISSSKTKSRKTWDPQVISTLQQLYSRKVEGSLMSPDGKKINRRQKTEGPSPLGDEDLVVGARESVGDPHLLLQDAFGASATQGKEWRSKIEQKTISVQDAINLFESKQQKMEDVPKKKTLKEAGDTEKLVEPVKLLEEVVDKPVAESDAAVEVSLDIQVANPAHETEDKRNASLAPTMTCTSDQPPTRVPAALAVVSEATELEELENIQWRPLSKSSGYIFDDMFLDQKNAVSQNTRRQSLCVWRTTWDSDFEGLDSVSQKPGGDKKELKGRFYDQYQEKREAKLKHEPVVKKAEKEAKLRAMQDVLEKRKAELSTRSMRLSDRNSNSLAKNITSKKEVDSRSSEHSKAASKRLSPITSVHSAPQPSKQESSRTASTRKYSLSQKSSTATTPRAASCDSKTVARSQRRSAESLYSDQGKENIHPAYASDIEVPQQHFKYLERKSKSVLLTKTNTVNNDRGHNKGEVQAFKPEAHIQRKGKQSPHSRQVSACSAVRGPTENSTTKLQKSRSEDLASSSVSNEVLPLKLDDDDNESSCSCPNAGATSFQEADPADDFEVEVTLLKIEVNDEALKRAESEKSSQNQVDQVEKQLQGGKDQDGEISQPSPKSDSEQLNSEDILIQQGFESERIASDAVNGSNQIMSKDINVEVATLVGASGVAANASTNIVEELVTDEPEEVLDVPEPIVTIEDVSTEAATTNDVNTKKPLFELAELDQKQFPAAYKFQPPSEDFSSSSITESQAGSASVTGGPSLATDMDASAESSSVLVGSFLPRSMTGGPPTQKCTIFSGALNNKSSDSAMKALSEPGSPTKENNNSSSSKLPLPLFDLLVTEQNSTQVAGSSNTINNNMSSNSNNNNNNNNNNVVKTSKSSSHKLPHMCRLPSPDSRGAAVVEKKLLQRSTGAAASSSASKLVGDSKPVKEPLKGFRKFLRFGRKSCGASSASSDRIMWQNGWFKGE